MGMNVTELVEYLEDIAEEHPDAEVRVDPPYHPVMSAYFRKDDNVVELSH